METENIQTRIEKRKEQTIEQLKLFSIELPRPSKVTKDIFLNLEHAQLFFHLFSDRNNNILTNFQVAAPGTKERPQQKRISTIISKVKIVDLVALIAYLQEHIELVKENILFKPYVFSIYNVENIHLFELQAIPKTPSSENEGVLQLNFKLNVREYSSEEDEYIEFQSSASFQSILEFTLLIQKFLIEAYVTDKSAFTQSYTDKSTFSNTSKEDLSSSHAVRKISFCLHRKYGIPIEQCVGIENWDENARYILIQTSVEPVARAFQQFNFMNIWMPDTYGKEIEIQPESILIFKFRGHKWSIIYEPHILFKQICPTEEDARKISEVLNANVIFYVRSDTSNFGSYKFFSKGKLQENLLFQEGIVVEFNSQLHFFNPKDINGGYSLISAFIREQGAYIPYLLDRNYFVVGEKRILQIKNLLKSEVERMDYLAKKRFKPNSKSEILLPQPQPPKRPAPVV